MSIDRQTSLCVNLSAFMYVFTWRLYVHSIVIAAWKLALTSNVSVCLAMWRLSQTHIRTRTQHVRHAMSMTKNHTQPPATTRHHQIHTHKQTWKCKHYEHTQIYTEELYVCGWISNHNEVWCGKYTYNCMYAHLLGCAGACLSLAPFIRAHKAKAQHALSDLNMYSYTYIYICSLTTVCSTVVEKQLSPYSFSL